ncbi:hypothetical protein ACS0TY_002835 [Phlomoides rotata]
MKLIRDLAAHSGRARGRQPNTGVQRSWEPPPRGCLKLNTDAWVFSDGSVGLGFVVRNSERTSILAGAKRCVAAGEHSDIIDALALWFGLEPVNAKGLQNLLLEVDSRNLSLAIRGELEVDTSTSLIIGDIKPLARQVGCCGINLVPREANGFAHALAHYGVGEDFECIWVDNIPCNWYISIDVRREPI